ncbi:MlaD family protein [Nocardia jinanensis]|uniref:Mce family protein n=1 Tax=Nocardia jinanensis TaxID=382504 RepID=A0A917R5D8_9NOCA|nr:MlaD family protein [Nocardia jinanensis]GGK90158.1 putative Mce family protein [Nocardia jinanensis]
MSSVRGPAIGLSVFGVLVVVCLSLVVTTVRGPATDADIDAEYTAVFTDASGLTAGSDVRIAGARIGTVTAIAVTDDTTARVGFTLGDDRPILDTTHAAVRYQSLLGQRYLELFESGPGGVPLAAGATIPRDRTVPSFDVSRLFSGFEPLFTALDIEQLGRLAENLVCALQGDSAAIGAVLEDLDDLLEYATNEHAAIVVLIHNLWTVAAEIVGLAEHVGELIERIAGLIGMFDRAVELVNSLFAEESGPEPEGGTHADPESLFDGTYPSPHELLRTLTAHPDQLVEVLALMPELINGSKANYPAGTSVSASTCSTWPLAASELAGTRYRALCR